MVKNGNGEILGSLLNNPKNDVFEDFSQEERKGTVNYQTFSQGFEDKRKSLEC